MRRLAVLWLTLMMSVVAPPLHAAAVPDAAAAHTVAIVTYYRLRDTVYPSKAFNGVLMDAGHIVTSRWALNQGRGRPFHAAADLQHVAIFAVVSVGRNSVPVRCYALDTWAQTPLVVLAIETADRALLGSLAPSLPVADQLSGSTAGTLVGMISPFGLNQKQLSSDAIPPAIGLPVQMGRSGSIVASEIGPVMWQTSQVIGALPPQLVGAGLWAADGRLAGLIVRDEKTWMAVGPINVEQLLNPPQPKPVEPEVAAASVEPVEPEPIVSGVEAILKDRNLEMVVDPNLVDSVGVPDADLAMALIAANQPAEALKVIEEAMKNAGGALREQLDYRKALALTLTGKHEEALPIAERVSQRGDPVVQARASLLHNTLKALPSGMFTGKPLTDPAVLVDAMIEEAAKIEAQVIEIIEAQKALTPERKVDFIRMERRVNQGMSRLQTYKLGWPGYFDDLEKEIEEYLAELRKKAAEVD